MFLNDCYYGNFLLFFFNKNQKKIITQNYFDKWLFKLYPDTYIKLLMHLSQNLLIAHFRITKIMVLFLGK